MGWLSSSWSWLSGAAAIPDNDPAPFDEPSVNPATGLPMVGGIVDVEGNPYGVDLHIGSSSSFADDGLSSCFDDLTSSASSFDDGFSTGSSFGWDD